MLFGELGDYFEPDSVLVRVGFIARCFAGGVGFVLKRRTRPSA